MKIAIFGMARSGLSVFKYINQKTKHEVFVVNQGTPESWDCFDVIKHSIQRDHCYEQDSASELFANVDEVILSPGIPRYHKALAKALELGVSIISEVEFTFRHSDIPIVGITGTNGKTTTISMLGEALNQFGKKAFVCGNIGRPYSDILLEETEFDYALVELSSFQLESIVDFHPVVSVLLNISDNHAERYDSFESYQHAKYQIFKNQIKDDFVLLGDSLSSEALQGEVKVIQALTHFDYSKSFLIGEHNKMNFYCVYKICERLGIQDLDKRFQQFINCFRGVEFRLEFITEYQNLKIYNDGKSTNNAATLAAINAFDLSEDLYLILGGKPRSDKTELAQVLSGQKIKQIFVFGAAKKQLAEALEDQFNIVEFNKLEEIFEFIKKSGLKGHLLFSPAYPSFDQYTDYEARGRHFTELALSL